MNSSSSSTAAALGSALCSCMLELLLLQRTWSQTCTKVSQPSQMQLSLSSPCSCLPPPSAAALCFSQPCRSFWLWFCDGLTVKDVLIMTIWAAYNAVWYSTILTKALSRVAPGLSPSPRLYAKSFASLMMPNIVPLMFPVSRWVQGCCGPVKGYKRKYHSPGRASQEQQRHTSMLASAECL